MKNEYFLVGDVGGTNTQFGLFRKSSPKITRYFAFDTTANRYFHNTVNDVLNQCAGEGIVPAKCCISVAGFVSDGRSELTNQRLTVDSRLIEKNTPLKKVYMINDFEAMAYGAVQLEKMESETIRAVRRNKPIVKAPKAIIGAGTGLGKCIMFYDSEKVAYRAYQSEGGREIFAPTNRDEYDLMEHMRSKFLLNQVDYEYLVSGRGIVAMYNHFSGQNLDIDADSVSANYNVDPNARKAFDLFVTFYARSAKNLALNVLPYGGLYLAGGIVMRTRNIFSTRIFMKEFLTHPVFRSVLRKVPVSMLTDYKTSLYGGFSYLRNFC
jgi:glucokinase